VNPDLRGSAHLEIHIERHRKKDDEENHSGWISPLPSREASDPHPAPKILIFLGIVEARLIREPPVSWAGSRKKHAFSQNVSGAIKWKNLT
jgi:hypothetical protein